MEEVATSLGITDNAVRSHLASLERDGYVRQEGIRRSPGAGKPASVYELNPVAAPLFSRAYEPVLSAMLEVLISDLPADVAEQLIRHVGRRLAAAAGGKATGDLPARVDSAVRVLTSLGSDVVIETTADGDTCIRGSGCPLSAAVSHRPEMCAAVETLIAEIVGHPVESCCQHGAQPRCCFVIDADEAA